MRETGPTEGLDVLRTAWHLRQGDDGLQVGIHCDARLQLLGSRYSHHRTMLFRFVTRGPGFRATQAAICRSGARSRGRIEQRETRKKCVLGDTIFWLPAVPWGPSAL